MKQNLKKWLHYGLFTLGGTFAGLGYYFFVGCASGSYPITSITISSMAYMGIIGWLLSGVFGKECECGCNI